MFKNRSKAFFVSGILGLIYSIYMIVYFSTQLGSSQELEEAIGAAIATALVLPHIILIVLATIFNIVGFFLNSRGMAITSGVLYSVGAVLFLLYAIFVLPMIILSFVSVSNIKKINESASSNLGSTSETTEAQS